MKAQERHELRENDLAGWLQYGLWAFVKEYGSYLLLGLSLAFLGFQVWRLYSQRQENARLEAWREFNDMSYRENLADYTYYAFMQSMLAKTSTERKNAEADLTAAIAMANDRPNELQKIIDEHDIKPLQTACYLNMGNFYLRLNLVPEVLDRMKMSRKEALEKGANAYQAALKLQPDDPLTSAQAHLGLAAVFEDQGEWDKARGEYKILTADPGLYAGTPMAKFASDRAAKLDERRNAPRLAAAIRIPKPLAPNPGSTDALMDLLGNSGKLPAGIPGNLQLNTPATSAPATNKGLDIERFMLPAGPTSKPANP